MIKTLYLTITLLLLTITSFSQREIQWDELVVDSTYRTHDSINFSIKIIPYLTKQQQKLDGELITLEGFIFSISPLTETQEGWHIFSNSNAPYTYDSCSSQLTKKGTYINIEIKNYYGVSEKKTKIIARVVANNKQGFYLKDVRIIN